jgi:hypothetical protein
MKKTNSKSIECSSDIMQIICRKDSETVYLHHRGRVLAVISRAIDGDLYYCNGRSYLTLESAVQHEQERLMLTMFDSVK